MREFWRTIVHTLEGGEAAELVSVIEASGSTPRGAGAMLAVGREGRLCGTIGGGNAEFAAEKHALELLAAGAGDRQEYRFRQGDAASLGMVCGGDVTVEFQYLPAGDARAIAVFRALMEAEGLARDTWLVRRLEGGLVTDMGLADRSGTRYLEGPLPEGLLENAPVLRDGWFAVPAVRAGRTYLFGGGHVSQALVPVLASVGFRPVVYDDRPEFASPALFPAAEQVLCGEFSQLRERLTIGPDDSVVVMTRGHQADTEVLEQVLRSGARYLGCIGSRRKLAACKEVLLSRGFREEEWARLHAPIGLAIGAETPEEIAVSVAAEMIAVRAGKME